MWPMKLSYESESFFNELDPCGRIGNTVHRQMMQVLKCAQGNLGHRAKHTTARNVMAMMLEELLKPSYPDAGIAPPQFRQRDGPAGVICITACSNHCRCY